MKCYISLWELLLYRFALLNVALHWNFNLNFKFYERGHAWQMQTWLQATIASAALTLALLEALHELALLSDGF